MMAAPKINTRFLLISCYMTKKERRMLFRAVTAVLILAFSTSAYSNDGLYSEFTVDDYLKLDESAQYSLMYQMRRAMRLGIYWSHYRAEEKGFSLLKGDESPMGSCLLHLSTGSIMERIFALVDNDPSTNNLGMSQAVSIVVLTECVPYDQWIEQLALEAN